VLQPGFFSRKDTRTPTIFAAVSLVINVVLSLALFDSLRHVGIALATSAAAWVNVLLLGIFLARRGHFSLSRTEWKQQAMIGGLTLAMALLLAAGAWLLAPVFAPEASFLLQALALLALCVLGAGFYFALVHLTGVQRLGGLLRALRRRKPA
jgi:putative peptidoglycan lipid II flippase